MTPFPPLTAEDQPDIELIDRQIANWSFFLHFRPGLEAQFEASGRDSRLRNLRTTGLIALVLYDLFLICDWQVIPDAFALACIGRLGIVTPAILITLYLLPRMRSVHLSETLSSSCMVTAEVFMLIPLVRSHSLNAPTYCYGTILLMIYISLIYRLRFRYAVVTLIVMAAITVFTVVLLCDFERDFVRYEIMFFSLGTIVLIAAAYNLERGERRAYLLVLRSRLLTARLDLVAKIDPLTGLWNRRHLNAAMKAAWEETGSQPAAMAVILVDLDHFKLFNDSYGHIEGDYCLARAGAVIRSVFGSAGNVAVRFGGEEFLIFIAGAGLEAAEAHARHLHRALHAASISHPALGPGKIVTASFGVAAALTSDFTPSALMAAADKALYQAKAGGRDCIRVAQSEPRPIAA